MDSLTHIAFGACIGEVFFGRVIGKKAMLWGVLAQSVPDIDFVAAFWMSPAENLLAHRGFTHSIIFILIVTPFLSLLAERWHRPHNISIKRWILFFALFNDLRFGQIIGWHDPEEKFVFHYFLQHTAGNKLVVQRGRFAKWNWEIMKSLFKRIEGN